MTDSVYMRWYRLRFGRGTGTRTYEMKPDEQRPFDGLRITFQVTHFAGGALSIAEITIYNVASSAVREMLGDGSTNRYKFISLEAGYKNLFGAIFAGQIVNVQRVFDDGGTTRGMRFFCMSAAKSYDETIINLTLAPETDPIEIIMQCAEKFAVEIQLFGDFSALPRRSGGTSFQGNPSSCMRQLSKAYGFDWMIENDVLKIIKNDYAGDVQVISATTGMIGSPVVTDSEVGIRSILNPSLKLGDTIKLESMAPEFEFSGAFFVEIPRTIGEGFYKINSLVFSGDSHGDPWLVHISCLKLSAAALEDISNRARR